MQRTTRENYARRVKKFSYKEVQSIALGWADRFFGFKFSSIVNCYKSLLPTTGSSSEEQVEAEGLKLDHHKMFFIFGDSLFDAGNNIYLDGKYSPAAYYPFGFTYFTNATGRLCDGRIVPDFIAQFANLPPIPPSLQPGATISYGVNFASAGATVLDSYPGQSLKYLNLRKQLSQFKEVTRKLNATLGSSRTREVLSKAVYLFSIGGDDYGDYYSNLAEEGRSPTWSEQQQQVNAVISNLTRALTEIYEQGARKIAFQNVGPMGCVPQFQINYPNLSWSCAPELLSMPILHNKELYGALTDFAERLEGFKFSVFDYFSSLLDRIDHPSDYGFESGSTPCYVSNDNGYKGLGSDKSGNTKLCEYPAAYLFFDVYGHTTQHANQHH
ncbi:hypothetical protein CRG98_040935 [Punica granatum]|uniref:GDSL esterase/lipase 1-like n=1 Tax=Punica granatum TaxID=22663 RepID=A0A2I0I417_PUNGR|nr:hypothetical protein CRG98_040935 [Punica granatum]